LTVGATDLFQVVSTGEVRSIAGTASVPTFAFTGDVDTGIYDIAADDLGITTAGAQRWSVNAARSLTSTPGTAAAPSLALVDAGLGLFRVAADDLGITTAGVQRWSVNAARSLTSTPGTAAAPSVALVDAGLGLFRPGADILAVTTAGAERVRVNAVGNVGIGIAPTARLHVDGGGAVNGPVVIVPPAKQVIAAGDTVTANACDSIKTIESAAAVATSTADTFTAPVAANAGCCMSVVNIGGFDITLDANANFVSPAAADVVMTPNDAIPVCSNGTKWYAVGPLVAN